MSRPRARAVVLTLVAFLAVSALSPLAAGARKTKTSSAERKQNKQIKSAAGVAKSAATAAKSAAKTAKSTAAALGTLTSTVNALKTSVAGLSSQVGTLGAKVNDVSGSLGALATRSATGPLVKLTAGDPPKVLGTKGPYTLTATCSAGTGAGAKKVDIGVTSSEAGAVLEGSPPKTLSTTTTSIVTDDSPTTDLTSTFYYALAPSGATAEFDFAYGVLTLGADCVASAGIR